MVEKNSTDFESTCLHQDMIRINVTITISRSFDEGDVIDRKTLFIYDKGNINVTCFRADLIKHFSIAWIFWIHEDLLHLCLEYNTDDNISISDFIMIMIKVDTFNSFPQN